MIRATLAGLAGAWIARDADRGTIPEGLAVPLTLVASRLPLPALVAGAVGYGIYRLKSEARASRAKDVTPKRSAEPGGRTAPRKRSASAKAPARRKTVSSRRSSSPATEPAHDVGNSDTP